MTKKMMNSKVRRTLAAVMSSIMIVSAGMAVSATAVSAASIEKASASSTAASGWKQMLSESDSALSSSLRTVKSLMDALSKKLPGGDYFKLFTFLLDGAEGTFSEKVSLKDVIGKLEQLQTKLDHARSSLIDSMESVSDMAEFTRLLNTVTEQTEALTGMLKNIQSMKSTHAQKSLMRKYIGTTSDWLTTSNIVFNLISFGKFLSGEKKLVSNDKTIYDTMMSHYSRKVLFGKEAMDKTDRFITSAMAIYLHGTDLLLQCIDAEKDLYAEEAEEYTDAGLAEIAYIEAINCDKKSIELCGLIENSNKMFDRYRATYSPFTLYDRSDPSAPQKSIALRRDLICQQHTKYLDTGDLRKITERSISEDAMKYIISYIRSYYPGMSVSDFLKNVIGFNLNTPDESKTWIAVGNLRTKSLNTLCSVINHYYYDGIKVNNTSLSTDSVYYAYHSITLCFDTHLLKTEGYVLFFQTA